MKPERSNNDYQIKFHRYSLVTIKAEDGEFNVEKEFLVSHSEYFSAMFRNPMLEATTGVVTFPEMSADIAKRCILSLYGCAIDVEWDIVEKLLDSAEMLMLPHLSKHCVDFIKREVNVENCTYVITLAQRYQQQSLELPLRKVLFESIADISVIKDFLLLDSDAFAYCLKFLQGGGTQIEELKWSAIVQWIRHDYNEREKHFTSLFETLNLSLYTEKMLHSTILHNPLVRKSLHCLDTIATSVVNDAIDVSPKCKRPRQRYTVFIEKRKNERFLMRYDSAKKIFKSMPSSLLNLGRTGQPFGDFLEHEGVLYIGYGNKLYQLKGDWMSRNPIQLNIKMYCANNGDDTSRYNRCVIVGDSLFMLTPDYVCQFNIVSSRLYRYDCLGVDLGKDFFVAASEKKIYAFGGDNTEERAIEIDIKSQQRFCISNMKRPTKIGHAFWHDGKVYVIGKYMREKFMDGYFPERDVWFSMTHVTFYRFPSHIHLTDTELVMIHSSSSPFFILLDGIRRNGFSPEYFINSRLLCTHHVVQ